MRLLSSVPPMCIAGQYGRADVEVGGRMWAAMRGKLSSICVRACNTAAHVSIAGVPVLPVRSPWLPCRRSDSIKTNFRSTRIPGHFVPNKCSNRQCRMSETNTDAYEFGGLLLLAPSLHL